jgi:pleckstrin homology domain-containing family M member 1
MSSFFKTTFFNDREKIIKQSLLSYLNNNTKEIQYEQLVKDETLNEFGVGSDHESLNSLCTTLEAIFLHGLKDSFLTRMGHVLGGAEDEPKPEPNFWPPLLIITHQNTIKQVYKTITISSTKIYHSLSITRYRGFHS